jgi:ketosteroid isomerase-like protein
MERSEGGKSDPVIEGHKIWIGMAKEKNFDKLATILADDIIMMPPNDTSLYGKAEVLEWFKEYFAHFNIANLTPTERDVFVVNDIAIENWTYMVSIRPIEGSDRIRDDGRFLTIWKKQPDGAWKISHSIWNSIRPIGSGTSRFLALMKRRPAKAGAKSLPTG